MKKIILEVLFFWFLCVINAGATQEPTESDQTEQSDPAERLESTEQSEISVVMDEEQILEDYYQISEVDISLDELFGENQISLKDIIMKLVQGDLSGACVLIKEGTIDKLVTDIQGYKQIFVSILLLGILAAFFTQFSDFFHSPQVSGLSYYLVYLMLSALMLRIFYYAMGITEELVENIVTLVKLLIPTFVMTVTMATGEMTALAFYNILLGVIYLVENLLFVFLLPFCYCYVILSIINGMMEQDRLNQILDLMKRAMEFLLKASLSIVTGFSVLQAMITPVIDNVKMTTVQKILSSLPGIGNIADVAAQTVYGSLIIIKNSVGIAFVLLLLFMGLIPILKLFILAIVVKIASGIVSIIAEKRISLGINRIGDGANILFKLSLTSVLLFIIAISVVAVSTNKGF